MPSILVGQQRKTAIQQTAVDDDSDTDDFHGLPVASDSDDDVSDLKLKQDAVAAVTEKVQGMSAGSGQRPGSSGSNGKQKGRPKGPTQVQNPPRTRPWPGGSTGFHQQHIINDHNKCAIMPITIPPSQQLSLALLVLA